MDQFFEFVVNHWILFSALVLILILIVKNWIETSGVFGVSSTEAVQLINKDNIVILDIRSSNEYQQGHLSGSIHIPLDGLKGRVKELEKLKSRQLLLVCQTGNRSTQASLLLKKQGFQNIHKLIGGIAGWQKANLPLSKDRAQEIRAVLREKTAKNKKKAK